MMQLTLQIVITDESGSSRTEELMTIQKSGETRNDIGLSVSESKLLLNTVQQSVVQLQADEYTQHHIRCPHCLAARRIKGKQKIRYRTLFGVIPVSGLRVYRCRCEESDTKTVSLLSDWAGDYSHPALKYIETRWASMISYEMTTRLLKDILPVGHSLNASTVRNHLCQVAQRLDAEAEAHSGFLSGCPRDWGNLPRPGKPLVVGIDGGYVSDQIACLIRMWLRRHSRVIAGQLLSLASALIDQSVKAGGTVMPGRTHMQHAQPVLLGHQLMAHVWPLLRDVQRLVDWDKRIDASPYGSGALAGNTLGLEPVAVARELEIGRASCRERV